MSIIINHLELKNWFNYNGDFDNNRIEFSEGLNIVVGDNNSGKSKLHNAFRWILKNEVIIVEENDATEVEIKGEYLKKVINQIAIRNVNIGDLIEFGVRIEFTKSVRYDNNRYLLTKEYVCRKDVEEVVFVRENRKVQLVDGRTNKPRTINEDFDSIAQKIISNNFLDFFLIEGEQLGQLTPLEGQKLQTTVNSIVNLQELDHLVVKSNSLFTKTDQFYDEVLKKEANLDNTIRKDIENIQEKKEEINEIRDSILEHEKIKDINQKLISNYKKKAENSAKKKKLIDQYGSLERDRDMAETRLDSFIRSHIASLMNESLFGISKVSEDSDIKEKLNKRKEEIHSFISKRRTEIDNKLTPEESKIIMSLEKSQPNPEILAQMVRENHCYVCDNDLSVRSKDFIEKKLIPFFNDETENDETLERLMHIHTFFKNIEIESSKYFQCDDNYYEVANDEAIKLIDAIGEAQGKIDDFLEVNGKSVLEEDDSVNINTYTIALEKYRKAIENIKNLNEVIKSLESEIGEKESFVKSNKGVDSEQLTRADSLKSFSKSVNVILRDYKKHTYSDFANRLQENATKRFQQLLKFNIASNHRIDVNIIEKSSGDFDFKIDVVNQFNEIQDQAGGADQALRRVSVVFALLDIAENKNGYPFIADAPTSRLSPDNSKEFFKALLNDSALKQSIILTMDLFSSEESKKQNKAVLSDIGKEILKEIKSFDGTRMIIIYDNKFEYLKN